MTETTNNRATDRTRQRWYAVLVLLVLLSRVLVFPASVWEQDEAYFAAAVLEIDLGDSAPHAPFFPLWIGIGKLIHFTGVPAAIALQLASAVLGSLMVIPLVSLWSGRLGMGLAVAGAILVVAVPGVWVLAPRAFSGTAATAVLLFALAIWTRAGLGRRQVAAGSAAAGIAVLIRPHFALVVAVVAVAVLVRIGWRRWAAMVLPALAVVVVGFGIFVVFAGGPAVVLEALSRHASGHFGALSTADWNLFESGAARVFVHPAAFIAWCVLTVVGATVSLRSQEDRDVAVPVLAALIVLLVLVFGLSNPTYPRYAIPLVVLSGGLVVGGLRRLIGARWTLPTVAVAVLGAAAVVLNVSGELRRVPSPPVRALDRAEVLVEGRGALVVADRRLHAFVLHGKATGALKAHVVFDHVFELGGEPPPPEHTVMVFDLRQDGRVIANPHAEDFTCDHPLLRRLSQDRFLDIRVVDGAAINRR